MSDFTPVQIGLQDIENQQKIERLYQQLTSCAAAFLYETQTLLHDEDLRPDFIIKILNMNRDQLILFLKREFIRRNNINYPGFNIEKLISQDLIDLPETYNDIIKVCESINEIIHSIEDTKFHFPLTRLAEENGFELNPEFYAELLDFTATFTKSEKQNQVLDVVQRFCEVLNDMIDMKIISGAKGSWQNVVAITGGAIIEDPKLERSLYPNRKMFKTAALNKFLTEVKVGPKTQEEEIILS